VLTEKDPAPLDGTTLTPDQAKARQVAENQLTLIAKLAAELADRHDRLYDAIETAWKEEHHKALGPPPRGHEPADHRGDNRRQPADRGP
jgi:hypothetical protein